MAGLWLLTFCTIAACACAMYWEAECQKARARITDAPPPISEDAGSAYLVEVEGEVTLCVIADDGRFYRLRIHRRSVQRLNWETANILYSARPPIT